MATARPTKTFLLGVGCHKGGTTWVHSYLAGAPECDPGFGGEYTIFDSLDVPEHTRVLPGIIKRARSSIDAVEARTSAHPNDLLRLAMMADQQVYYDYFTALLNRPGISLTMDITPNYALLPARRLAEIRSEFGRRDTHAVALFILRDPVERIWSQVRMHRQRGGRSNPQPDHVLVERRFAKTTNELRTRYEDTVRRLDDVFGSDSVHYAFYEQLFQEPQLRGLCQFLDIPYLPVDASKRVNASPKSGALPVETEQMVARHFRSTYDFVADRFGVTDLEALWPSSRHLG